MLSVTTPAYCDHSGYQLSTLSRPPVSEPTDVLIGVHAASINPVDIKKAAGVLKRALKDEYARWMFSCLRSVDSRADTIG